MELKIGAVVQSVRGHDEGFFAVLQREGKFAYLANGKQRPLEKPKKKNVRHLRDTGLRLDLSGIRTDRGLRAALRTAIEEEGRSWQKKM